jgi:DNA-binding NtrC family response regulator
MSYLAGKTILVVDDEKDICDLIGSELKDQGCPFFIAYSVAEALTILKNSTVDLIISDIRMPSKSGMELMEEIRSVRSQIPVILMTGFSDISEKEAIRRGAHAVITKPFEMTDMIQVCEVLLKV